MTKKIYRTIYAGMLGAAFAVGITSCSDDFLDKNPKLAVTEKQDSKKRE